MTSLGCPAPSDNVAIVTRRLEANSEICFDGETFELSHTILEGHRYAIRPIPVGEPLLSWGLPFGFAISQIRPGDYVCNQKMIDSLSLRHLDFDLPTHPNFRDEIITYHLDEENFQSGAPVSRYDDDRFFDGYQREGRTRRWHAKLHCGHEHNLADFRLCQHPSEPNEGCRRGL